MRISALVVALLLVSVALTAANVVNTDEVDRERRDANPASGGNINIH